MQRMNTNSTKTAKRLDRLTLGNLPKPLARVQRYVRQYRRQLEEAVRSANHAEISMEHAHTIDVCVKHEQHAQIARHILRERWAKMTPSEAIECSDTITRATERRNKAFFALQLGKKSLAELLYGDDDEAALDGDACARGQTSTEPG